MRGGGSGDGGGLGADRAADSDTGQAPAVVMTASERHGPNSGGGGAGSDSAAGPESTRGAAAVAAAVRTVSADTRGRDDCGVSGVAAEAAEASVAHQLRHKRHCTPRITLRPPVNQPGTALENKFVQIQPFRARNVGAIG